MRSNAFEKLSRAPTEVPGLDRVLGGGLVESGVYIVQGPPGSGKTVLANQIAFRCAARGGIAVYITMLAESHARMLQHISGMSFFDPSAVPERVYYISGYSSLQERGLIGVIDMLTTEIRVRGARFVVIDGLTAQRDTHEENEKVRAFVHTVQSLASALGCQILVLTSGAGSQMTPEQTMVDGMFQLDDQVLGGQPSRTLRVRKFRGGDYLRGEHTFCITDDGVTVFPRMEVAHRTPPGVPTGPAIPTGIASLDALAPGGGLPAGTATLVVGRGGAGKTALGLAFVAQATPTAPAMFVGGNESPARLLRLGSDMGLPVERCEREGSLHFLWLAPGERSLDEIGYAILDRIRRHELSRLFVDGLSMFFDTPQYASRGHRFFAALLNELRSAGVLSMFTLDTDRGSDEVDPTPVSSVFSLSDNIVDLSVEGERTIGLRKMRLAGFAPSSTRYVLRATSATREHGARAGMAGTPGRDER